MFFKRFSFFRKINKLILCGRKSVLCKNWLIFYYFAGLCTPKKAKIILSPAISFFLQISFLKNAFSLLKRFYFRPVIFNISRSYAQRGRQKPRFSNNYGLAENINKLPFRYRKCVFVHKNWLCGGRNFF